MSDMRRWKGRCWIALAVVAPSLMGSTCGKERLRVEADLNHPYRFARTEFTERVDSALVKTMRETAMTWVSTNPTQSRRRVIRGGHVLIHDQTETEDVTFRSDGKRFVLTPTSRVRTATPRPSPMAFSGMLTPEIKFWVWGHRPYWEARSPLHRSETCEAARDGLACQGTYVMPGEWSPNLVLDASIDARGRLTRIAPNNSSANETSPRKAVEDTFRFTAEDVGFDPAPPRLALLDLDRDKARLWTALTIPAIRSGEYVIMTAFLQNDGSVMIRWSGPEKQSLSMNGEPERRDQNYYAYEKLTFTPSPRRLSLMNDVSVRAVRSVGKTIRLTLNGREFPGVPVVRVPDYHILRSILTGETNRRVGGIDFIPKQFADRLVYGWVY